MNHPPTYQIRPLSREEIAAIASALQLQASVNERQADSYSSWISYKNARSQWKEEAALLSALARDLLSTMEATDDARADKETRT